MTAVVERTGATASRPNGMRFSALVVSSSPVTRAAVVRGLTALGAVEVSEAGSAAEARVRAAASGRRELLVVDLTLPDGSGLALLNELRSGGWTRGIVLSSADDVYTVRAALAGGARSFLVAGQPASAGPGSLPGSRRPNGSGAAGLSSREIEVLQLVSDGKTNKDIGTALGLSALTVKSHLARIARKLGTGDRAEMVVVALRAGVVS